MKTKTVIKTLTAEELRIFYQTNDGEYKFELSAALHNVLSYAGVIKISKKYNRNNNTRIIIYSWTKSSKDKLHQLLTSLIALREFYGQTTLKEIEKEMFQLLNVLSGLTDRIYKYTQEY